MLCGPDPLSDHQDTDLQREKERTVNFVEVCLSMPVYNAGTRVGPPAGRNVKMDDRNLKLKVYKIQENSCLVACTFALYFPGGRKQLKWLFMYSCVMK